ncbi:MAG: Lrp/AsnC family transcriptional regulator [Candidatus Lokiarchaeota archaeon]|nr:Lrp/AsnC family transcriptional regulator [Candidatus Lokiarchaeota archaeon]
MATPTVAYLLIEIASGEEYNIIKNVKAIEEVKEAFIVYGAWDVIIKIGTETMGHLNSLVLKIRKMPGVKRSATLIALTSDDMQ